MQLSLFVLHILTSVPTFLGFSGNIDSSSHLISSDIICNDDYYLESTFFQYCYVTLIYALPSRSESRNICEQEGWYFSWCVGKRNSSTSEIRTPASIGLIDILSTPFHSIVPIALSPIAAFLPLLSLLSCHLWSLDWFKFYFSPWWELCKGRNLSTLLWQTMLSCRYNIARETHMLDSEDLLVDTVAVAFAMAIYFVHMKIMDIRCHVRCGNKRC